MQVREARIIGVKDRGDALYAYPWVDPSHIDAGLGHVTCFHQWNIRSCDGTVTVHRDLLFLAAADSASYEEAQASLLETYGPAESYYARQANLTLPIPTF